VSGIIDGKEVPIAARELKVLPLLFAIPHTLSPLSVMTVVMVLMDGGHKIRDVNNIGALLVGLPNQPLIPPQASDPECRYFRIESAAKGKIIDGPTRLLNPVLMRELLDAAAPLRITEIYRFRDIRIAPASDHQKSRAGVADARQSLAKLWEQDNVAVYVAENIVAGRRLCLLEHAIDPNGAMLVALQMGFMAKAQFAGSLCAAVVVAKENDLDLWMEKGPALDGVALDDPDVPGKCLGNRKYR